MAYISSDDVTVFPSSRRPGYPLSKYSTEYNLTSIVNRLIDTDNDEGAKGFVITDSITNGTNEIEFNIKGYYFKVSLSEIISMAHTGAWYTVYAIIKLNTYVDNVEKYIELSSFEQSSDNLDDISGVFSGKFTGLKFDDSESSGDGEYSLPILELKNEEYIIPEESKLKFKTDAKHRSVYIDDGDLDKQ